MTTRSFALTALIAALPGAAGVVLIVLGILGASGNIFGSVPLAITTVVALICGVVAAVLPLVAFLKKGNKPAVAAPAGAAADGDSGEVFAGDSSGEIVAADGDTGEVLVMESGEFAEAGSEEFAEADSAEFVEAESAEFASPADDDDPFADFAADDEEDDFFDSDPANKK